jgi:hypothetical protein
MPSHLHEILVEMFWERPALAADLPAAARAHQEVLMHAIARRHGYQSEFARAFFAQGEARAVLAVLDARGIDVPEKVRDEIGACTDPDLLEACARRAATAAIIDDLFV